MRVRYLLEKTLSDGSTAYYYNAPKAAIAAGILESCTLPADKGEAVTKAEIYNKLYDEWKTGDRRPVGKVPGSIGWLIDEFKESSWYPTNPKTQKGYAADLKRIEEYLLPSGKKLGLFLTIAVTSTMADAMYLKLQARNAAGQPTKLRTANGVMVMAARLWKFGKRYHKAEHGIDDNPFAQMGLIKTQARSERWTMEQVETFVAKADEMDLASIGTAALICYGFNQRVTTAITVGWTSWDGNAMLIRQSKRGRLVWVPALPEVRTRLNAALKIRGDAVTIVISERTGKPYDQYLFTHHARDVADAAGIPKHLQLRDLRRTGTSETRDAGGTIHELQATTGNDLESLQIYAIPSNAEAASAMKKRARYRTKLKRKSE